MLYANYIRNKMHNVVKRVFSSGYPLKIISKFNKKAVDYTIHGKTEIGKNLIPYPYMYTTKTENGVTWTDNGDGSVTVSGTATGYSDFIFKIMSIAPNTTFTFSKNQSNDAANIAFMLKQLDENRVPVGTEINLIPNVVTHTFNTVENARYIQIACKRYRNAECKGTYKPMLELGDTATEYEPYTKYGVGDLDSESGKYKITLINAGKNLIIYPYAVNMSVTRSGVTFTDNGYGIVTANGTATANISLLLNKTNITLENGTYTLSGCPEGGGINTYKVYSSLYKGAITGVNDNISDIGSGATIDTNLTGYNAMRIYIRIMKDTVCNNLVFKPMLCKSETATEYEPYRAPDTTNVYHTTPLKDGESISYKADDLPELQLYKGENNITADTAVAPSTIDIKYLN